MAAVTEPAAAAASSQPLPGLRPGQQANVRFEHVSKWYGDIVAVSDLSFGIPSGVTGLLGPNGAGKSTCLKMMAGLLKPSSGSVTIGGDPVRGDPRVYRRLGVVWEQEHVYPFLTGAEFVRMNAIMQGLPDPEAAAARAIALAGMTDAAERQIGGYSKGMRQRIKVAAALAHDPETILRDEPLNGADPVQRAAMIALMRRLGEAGRTVVVSSHVLSEVERFAQNILVIVNGKLAAAGDYRAIRERMDERPREIRIRAGDPRLLAASLIANPATRSIRLEAGGWLAAETGDVRAFSAALPRLARDAGVRLHEVLPADESLASVFAYLVER
ncbi:MAG: ABC transporter ATP-binding protein [Chloroflexota bacterium]